MTNSLIRRLIVLGVLAIIGIVFVQSYWTIKTYDLKQQEFHESVMIALRQVAERYAQFNNSELPKNNLIQRRASNYYSVNINSTLDVHVLEDYLEQELADRSIETEIEYAVYDCFSDDLVYGNCCQPGVTKNVKEAAEPLVKFHDLVYYFVVRFPEQKSYLLSNLWQTILFNIIALLACIFFAYSMWVILKQKRLSEQQTDFINNMTHEFKTPISSIKIAADVFSKNEFIKNDKRLSHYASIITDQNQRLNDQVEKVLNIARSEEDGFNLHKEKVDLNEIIKSTINAEQAKLNKQKVKLVLNLDENINEIEADVLHLTNIIANVIDNAIKYCDQLPLIKITTFNSKGSVCMSIKDNGIGIAKDDLKKVMEKFYRVSTGDVHDVKGFGLGLFYVNRICVAHRWSLKIDSDKENGTDVKIIF